MLILQKMPISAELALPTFELLLPTFWGSNPRICWNFSRVPGSVERTCVTSVSQGSWRKYMPTHSDNNLCLSRRYRKIWGKFRLDERQASIAGQGAALVVGATGSRAVGDDDARQTLQGHAGA